MPQNMDVVDTNPRQAALQARVNAQPTLRQPISDIRSVDLNKEVPFDDDDAPNEIPAAQNQPKDETSGGTDEPTPANKPREVDLNEKVSDDDEGASNEKKDEISFEELDGDDGNLSPSTKAKLEKVDDAGDAVIPAGPRDYKSFPDPALVPVLKALNNKQYKELEPVLRGLVEKAKKSDELEKSFKERPEKPVYQYESPEAYKLDPQYNKLATDAAIGSFEVNHWRKQLLRVKSGQPWQNLDYDPKTGQPIYSTVEAPEDGKIDIRSETMIQDHLASLHPQVSQLQQQIGAFENNYRESSKQINTQLDEVSTRLFPKLQDLSKLPPEDKEWYELAVNSVPQVFKDHPIVTKILGRMAVTTMKYRRAWERQAKEIKTLKAQLEDKVEAEPTAIPRGQGRSGDNGTGGKAFKYKDGRVIKASEVVRFDED